VFGHKLHDGVGCAAGMAEGDPVLHPCAASRAASRAAPRAASRAASCADDVGADDAFSKSCRSVHDVTSLMLLDCFSVIMMT